MRTYQITLPNGKILSSGVSGEDAICALELSYAVCDETELSPGSCCAAMMELELVYYGDTPVCQGDRLVLFAQEGTVCTQLGIFYAEQPVLTGSNRMKLTAYDGICRLDRELTDWLGELENWPYTAAEFARMVADRCGLDMEAAVLPNGQLPIGRFSGQITGRRLMQWLGQCFGRFLVADAQGVLCWRWYRENNAVRLGSTSFTGYDPLSGIYDAQSLTLATVRGQLMGQSLTLSGLCAVKQGQVLSLYARTWQQRHYLMNTLQADSYWVAPIERVRIRATRDDVGTCWPQTAQGNTYDIIGNPLLSGEGLSQAAQTIFEVLGGFSYVPCRATVPLGHDIAPGDILRVTDDRGNVFLSPVMKVRYAQGCAFLESTGSPRRDSTTASNQQSFSAISGKLLRLNMDVDGLRLENSDSQKALAKLSLTVDGVQTQVQAQQANATLLTQLSQKSDALSLQVQSLRQEGVSQVRTETGYTLDRDGLRICKSGQQMENLLDNTGMYVRRGGEVILRASHTGVSAVDVQVGNYLHLGAHCRFEDYAGAEDANRTACFFV